ncbi:hypothetical protein A8924_1082 [Saccharopolyspora erythraea NRRL 2338]|uniref:Uncharacterized protein n=1 Tax=Saccharopolyspora erythraea TaxID=1836 RepID=A0ABP3P5Y3_SACER|nr:hypothetical protein A8924_1082 [Saccharopolyspora erythraea NRRL 2338]
MLPGPVRAGRTPPGALGEGAGGPKFCASALAGRECDTGVGGKTRLGWAALAATKAGGQQPG